jgi:hypothetical protein
MKSPWFTQAASAVIWLACHGEWVLAVPVPDRPDGQLLKFTAFDVGARPFYQEVMTETNQLMKLMGQEVRQIQKQTFYIKWTPKARDREGNFVVTQEIVAVKMDLDIGGNKIVYDSTLAQQPQNPMADFFRALLQQKLTYTVSPTLKIQKIEGWDDFLNGVAAKNPAMKQMLQVLINEQALGQMVEPTWFAVPIKAVNPGESWTRQSKIGLGVIGNYETTHRFTYQGQDASRLDKIKIVADLKYTAPVQGQGGLPFVIKRANLASKGSTGEARFDRAKGRIDSSTMTMKLEGDVSIEVGGMVTDIFLTQEQVSTTRTYDANPLLRKQ